jgi:hypothetical protein
MYKRSVLFLFILSSFSCNKGLQKQSACGTQVCNDIFASVNIYFADNTGKIIVGQNPSAFNKRTNLALTRVYTTIIPMVNTNYYVVADDNMLSQFSTDGDDILVTATNPATNQTKSTTLKISGGCSCHVRKLSGLDTLRFD